MKGPWGFGKTLAALSFAVEGPVYLSYWDKKAPIEALQFFKKHRPDLIRNIEYDVFGANNAIDYLNKMIALSKDCPYIAVVNDSVTNMTSAAVNWSLSYRDSKKKEKLIPDFDEYKVETSIVTQALDICGTLPCHVIWTAHPIPSLKVEGAGTTIRVSKVNNIVTYGSKVAGIIPGKFSEIYHFSKLSNWNAADGKSSIRYLVATEAVGDDYAKSNIGLSGDLDITDKLFYEVWKEAIKQMEVKPPEPTIAPSVITSPKWK
ncbi:MAG: hypothetical protein ABWY25_06975 [Paenisporosarcina sp.]